MLVEPTTETHGATARWSPDQALALARARLSRELAALPPWPSAALHERIHAADPQRALSSGALVTLIRGAHARGDAEAARECFVVLLARSEGESRRWATRTVAGAHTLIGEARSAAYDDLLQELTLYLWERIALREDEAWALFFARSLDYARRHVATATMRRHGYWTNPASRAPKRGVALRLAAATEGPDDREGLVAVESFSAADLSDLRGLVLRLPHRERVAVVLRFWQGASEQEIALALGGVTTRTVRNVLRRAFRRLSLQYRGEGNYDVEEQ